MPNVFLNAPLRSDGPWNAAHFKNPQYDALASSTIEAIDFQTQKTIAGKIQSLLLDETPLIIPYFFDALTVSKKTIGGVVNTGMGQIFLDGAGSLVARPSPGSTLDSGAVHPEAASGLVTLCSSR